MMLTHVFRRHPLSLDEDIERFVAFAGETAGRSDIEQVAIRSASAGSMARKCACATGLTLRVLTSGWPSSSRLDFGDILS
jgi:hypothetical protein